MDHIDPQQYDQHAYEFEGLAQAASYNAFYERPATLELVGDVAGKRVLDVACGPGWHAKQLVAKGADVIGCDASLRMVELAQAAVGQPDAFRVHECDDPFYWVPDQSIDLVLMALAYHYVNDHDHFLAEMHRVLRRRAAFVISTHHPMDDFRRLGGSYFDHERVTERWATGWEIATLRMPLTVPTAGVLPGRFHDRKTGRAAASA